MARDADIPGIFEVRTSVRENHLSLEELARRGITPGSIREMMRSTSRAWVAEEDGEVVAFSMANAEEATVWAMFVRPEFEGRGIGRELMRLAEEWLFSRGCGEIWLLTDRDPQVRANGFYQRLRWTSVGVQEDGQIKYVKKPPASSERPAG
ncbi:MAG TPA: GNAT family N-acetyltransferase [Longimicrobium sp.]|nr:GNAT family N-acetyltransferase [Longimicrobium sp.]